MKPASRRSFLQGVGSVGALALLRCAGNAQEAVATGADAGGGSPLPDVDAATLAVGSGALFVGKDYGNPFANGIGTTCATYRSTTKGPCHSNTYNRKDVSDGLVGLPTRFELLVLDRSCNPVPNAIVDIWYVSPAGAYSRAAVAIDTGVGYAGSLSELNVAFCTGNDGDAVASNWLRGFQTSDANGRVTIDGIFPGWYPGRTAHVHFIVSVNGRTTMTSQLAFDEALTTTVYTQHPSYRARGDQDTSNARDGVFGGTVSDARMAFALQPDGHLVCWKAISVA